MSRVYLDASCIIYGIEGTAPVREALQRKMETALANPAGYLITSRLSRVECRTKPLRDGDLGLLATYDAFFTRSRLVLGDVTAAVLERSTDLRARYRFKTPDAVHLATAIEARADLLLTGDIALVRCTEVRVEVISP